MKMRVWYEYYSVEQALAPQTMDLLKKYGVCVGLAFPYGCKDPDHERLLRTWHEQGIEVALWPLLPDHQGYWPNERNVAAFCDYVKELFDWAEAGHFTLPWLAVDLEPPIYMMEKVKRANLIGRIRELHRLAAENRDLSRFYDAARRFEQLNEFIHARGSRTLVPIASSMVLDIVNGSTTFQDLLETPVSPVNWDMLSVMIYTSMFVGYSKGVIRPKDARWHLYATMRDLKEKLWSSAGVSIGVTGIGKLGDEPYYETPEQLRPDMEAAKAALIDDITIYNLEGILKSKQPEAWFETLLEAEPRVPERSLRVDGVRLLGRMAGRLIP